MAITLKEVAEYAQVSRSAVSRTFTPGASVSAKTRAKVVAAANALGYHPNALASSLTTGRTKLIGLVLNNFHNPLFLEIFDLFTRGLQDNGLRPLLVNLTDETDPEQSVRMLRAYSVDAAVVASSTLPPGFAVAFAEAGIPVVHSFGRAGSDQNIPVIGIDNVKCGRMAAAHLIGHGYRDIAFLGGPKAATSTQDRLAGFLEEIARHDDVTASYSFAEGYSFAAGRAEMFRLLDAGPAQAYFCGDDVLSIGALSAIQHNGLSVPGDIGLMGLNDMEIAGWENINLSTIRQPIDEIIRASVETVMQLLETPDHAPPSRIFDCTIVERGSLNTLG